MRACDADILKFKKGEASKATAMAALRRRKMLEQQVTQLSGTHAAVEQIQFAVESAELQHLAIKAMRQTMNAADILPKIGDVENLADEMEEFMEDQREMAEIMRPQGLDINDADLEAEFADLEAELEREGSSAATLPAPSLAAEPASREAHSL